jgi:hypothetical protein
VLPVLRESAQASVCVDGNQVDAGTFGVGLFCNRYGRNILVSAYIESGNASSV